jgi:flagellar protein FliJ
LIVAFQFRYESLLSYRNHAKERAEIAFSKSLREVKEARESLEALTESRTRANRMLLSAMAGTIPSHTLRNHSDYQKALAHKIEAVSNELARCERRSAERKEALLKKTKDCKVMEKLKEKDKEQWRAREDRFERKAVDEMSLIRYTRKEL